VNSRLGNTAVWAAARRAAVLIALSLLACAPSATDPHDALKVDRVVDGDTLIVGGERVRLVGVDAPESVHPQKPVQHFAKEATEFARQRAQGKQVRLEPSGDLVTRDRHGRRLAYVWLPDGLLLNLEIIRQGYGFAFSKFPFARMEEFRAAEREARTAGRGMWANPDSDVVHTDPSREENGRWE
jgi:endonuclease YncB( thermonuclease family)